MRKLKQKVIALTTVVAMGIAGAYVALPEQMNRTGVMEVKAAEGTGLNVEYHTQEEIAAYINEHSEALNFTTTYAEEPSAQSPYSAGALSEETLNNAAGLLNIYRYVAGIPYNVTVDADYTRYAQTGALVNASNNVLSHFPTQPSGMSTDMYDMGYKGCSSSNLAMGFNLCGAIKNGWMYDGDAYNIDRLGHRRWCLNPKMSKTGFGEVKSATSTYRYTSMYCFDSGNSAGGSYSGVAWPAQNTPTTLFYKYTPWSISMGSSVDAGTVQVTLECANNGTTYQFSSSSADGDFYVENGGYGQKGCIIFRPTEGTDCTAGYTYHVSITGSYTSGSSFSVNYDVNFFDVANPSESDDSSLTNGTWMQSGGRWWYKNEDGSYPTGWAKIDSVWYLFDSDGWMLTGWQRDGGSWYYLGGDGAMRTGWLWDGGKWYFLESSGAMATGWLLNGDKWYYLESSGAMRTGWLWNGGNWYYLKSSGAMATGWRQINGTWYYMKPSGEMVTGTVTIDGQTYTFSQSGAWIR